MAAQTIDLSETQEITLATTLTELVFGDGVRAIVIACASDVYVCRDDSKSDGDSVSATARFRVPAGVVFPVENNGPKALVAAVSGTPVMSAMGVV